MTPIKNLLPFTTVSLLLLTASLSCKKHDGDQPRGSKIQFTASIEGAASIKASGNTWDANDYIGIFSSSNANGAMSDVNKKYTTTGNGNFTATGADLMNYPADGSSLNFVAYYPYNASVTGNTYPVNVATQASPTAIDLMYSNNAAGYSQTSSANPNLIFTHRLSKIELTISSGTGVASTAGVAVAFQNFNTTASFDLSTGTLGAGATPANIAAKMQALGSGQLASAILLPLTDAGGKKIIFTLGTDIYIWTLPANSKFEAGKKYTYNIALEKSATGAVAVVLGTAPISNWTDIPRGDDVLLNANPPTGKMDWWRDARFGMFIHFGVYAQFGGLYRGYYQKVDDGAWLFNRMKVPVQEYMDTARNFNPINFNADDWARMAKDAGMKYIVVTAKHHEGFAMFDTKASNWSIMKASAYGKDIIKPLAEACQKYGLRLGLYYSQSQDWGNAGGSIGRRLMREGWPNPDSATIDAYTLAHNGSWDPYQTTKTFQDYFQNVSMPQVRELLTNYGKVSIIWWDTPRDISSANAKTLYDIANQLQPGIIQNDRLGGGFKGDYETPEQAIPNPSELVGKDWETCMTMNDTWGFRYDDHNWKTSDDLLRKLIDIASKGGNFLLNVGPKPNGEFPQESIDRLAAIGKWTKLYGEAVYGTQASPVSDVSWGRITAKNINNATTLYLAVFNWPANGTITVEGLTNNAINATLLNGSNANLQLSQNGTTLTISGLPAVAPDKVASVIAVRLNGIAPKK